MANLLELFDNVVEFQNYNGVPLAAGKMYVYALGRTRLMDTWSDIDGESLNPNPIILDDLGQCHCYVSDSFDYTIVVCDQFDNEIFSVDKYLLSKGEHSHADVAVAPSEHIGVSSYHVGEVTVYVPYLTGDVGKTYEGIDPIVVNNTLNRISANHIPLGVQDPLYFVEDSETACIIGCSAQTEIPAELSGKWDEASDAVIANSAQWAEGTEYEAGSYVSIDNNTINVTGLQPEGDYAYNSALSSKLDVTATGQFLTGLPEDLVYTADITGLATTAQLDEKLDKSDSGNFYPMNENPSGYINELPSDLATTGWVDSQGYLTSVDIPESATWNATTQTVSANSAQWAGGTANPQIPVTGINGIKISESGDKVVFEVSANYATEDWVTGQGYLTAETDWTNTITAASANAYNEATAAIPTGLATTGDLQTVSGEITAMIPSTAGLASEDWVTGQGYITNDAITGKQDITGMTAYATVESLTSKQDAGDYLSASDSANFLLTSDSANFYTTANESGFITGVDLTPYQLTADMTAYQPTGDYLTTEDSANFYTTANESGFITGVPDTYLQNIDLTITDGKVTEISGVPLSAGDELPEAVSAATDYVTANSATINGTVEAVTANSGVWGGAGLPISAGPGITVNLINNTLVFSTDYNESVLFENTTGTNGNTNITLSESISNFKYVQIDFSVWSAEKYSTILPVQNSMYQLNEDWYDGNNGYYHFMDALTITGTSYTLTKAAFHSFGGTSISIDGDAKKYFKTYKVIGINRTAGGN